MWQALRIQSVSPAWRSSLFEGHQGTRQFSVNLVKMASWDFLVDLFYGLEAVLLLH
jgi:hypothetical protein